MCIHPVALAFCVAAPVIRGASVAGDYQETTGKKSVMRVDEMSGGIRVHVFEYGREPKQTYELRMNHGRYSGRLSAATLSLFPGLKDVEVALSTRDEWNSAEFVWGFNFDTPRQHYVDQRHFVRVTSQQAEHAAEAQETTMSRKAYVRGAKGEFQGILTALRAYAREKGPTVDPKIIRSIWGTDCAPVQVPDDQWLAGCHFAYQASMRQANGETVFTVHGVGMTAETRGITCRLVGDRPSAELDCSGL
jgi:hypothetical protein